MIGNLHLESSTLSGNFLHLYLVPVSKKTLRATCATFVAAHVVGSKYQQFENEMELVFRDFAISHKFVLSLVATFLAPQALAAKYIFSSALESA